MIHFVPIVLFPTFASYFLAYVQALEDAFLAIDAKLTTEEVIKELAQIAGRPTEDEDEKEKVADEDDGECGIPWEEISILKNSSLFYVYIYF